MVQRRSLSARARQKLSLEYLQRRFPRWAKNVRQQFFMRYHKDKIVLLILGCQRSGTDMTQDIFERDFRTKTYGEFSRLSCDDEQHRIRLNAAEKVERKVQNDKAPLIVLKPIVESQNASDLLERLDNAKVLWVFRHYKDVASSNLRFFGIRNGINNLRPIVEQAEGNWRSEKVPYDVRQIVLKHFSEEMKPHDAAALFWYVRNCFFFYQDLQGDPRVLMCKYEDLVTDPYRITEQMYAFLGLPKPSEKVFADAHPRSVGKGKDIDLSPEVEMLCEDMWSQLGAAYPAQQARIQSQA